MKTTKKIILTGIACCFYVSGLFAGGLLTNTNQSVHFLRNPARDASTEIDAVYTNPAGLAKLSEDGFHFSLNNQSAFQTRTITSTFEPFALDGGIDTKAFKGTAKALAIPSLMAAYKTGNWVFSGNFAIVGGGGTLTFDKGLPSFEAMVAGTPVSPTQNFAQALTALNGVVSNPALGYTGEPLGYSLNMRLKGSSITYGVQLGATYKINDMFSAFVGGRVNIANNSYEGYLNNVAITSADAVKTHLTNTANALEGVAPEQAAALRYAVASITGLEQGVSAVDMQLNTKQTGLGVAPILGVNFNWNKLNVGVKYEFKTSVTLKNDTKVNTTPISGFSDGEKTPYDIPALFTIGAQYDIVPCVTVSAGYHHFFDSDAKEADYVNGGTKYIKGGINEYLLGAEWRINEMFLISAGGQITRTGVTDDYQSDLNFSLNSHSIGFGGAVNVSKSVRINVAYFFTNYENWTKDKAALGTDVFGRTNKTFGIGVDFRF